MLSSLGLINQIKMIFGYCTEGFFGLLPVFNGEMGLRRCGHILWPFPKVRSVPMDINTCYQRRKKEPFVQINSGFAAMFNMLIVMFQEKDMVGRVLPTYLTKEFFFFYLSYLSRISFHIPSCIFGENTRRFRCPFDCPR